MVGVDPLAPLGMAEEVVEDAERVDADAKNAFAGYLHCMRSASLQVMTCVQDGQSWMLSHPEADAEEVKKKHNEVEGICDSIFKEVNELVAERKAFYDYLERTTDAFVGVGDAEGIDAFANAEETKTIGDALKNGRSWLDSNPEADAEQMKEKREEAEGFIANIISKHTDGADDEDEEDPEL